MNRILMKRLLFLMAAALVLIGCISTEPQSAQDPDFTRKQVEKEELVKGILERLQFLDLLVVYKNTTEEGNSSWVFYTTNGVINKRVKKGEIGFQLQGGKVTRVSLCPEYDCGYAGLQETHDALDVPFKQYVQAKELLKAYFANQPQVSLNDGKDFLEYDLGFQQLQEQGFISSYSLQSSGNQQHAWRVQLNLSGMHGGDFSSSAYCDLLLDERDNYFNSVSACLTDLQRVDGTKSYDDILPKCTSAKVDQQLLKTLPDAPGNMVPTYCLNLQAGMINSLKGENS